MVVVTWPVDVAGNALYVLSNPIVLRKADTNNSSADVQLQKQIKFISAQLQVEAITTSECQVFQLYNDIRVHVGIESGPDDRAIRQMKHDTLCNDATMQRRVV